MFRDRLTTLHCADPDGSLVFAPNGQRLAYLADPDGNRLRVRS